jgi:hypothetical protein
MQTICHKLDGLRAQGQEGLSEQGPMAKAAIESVSEGHDAWGRRFAFHIRSAGTGVSYVLVSLGSDGVADYTDPTSYFGAAETSIHSQPARDIVFRDGRPITLAGK